MNESNVNVSSTFLKQFNELLQYINYEDVNIVSQLIVTIVLVIFLIIGLIGNSAICILILRYKAMRTSSNYYLLNLAICDLIFIISGPFGLYSIWHAFGFPFDSIGCKFTIYLMTCLSTVSLFTISAFAFLRYMAIKYPLTVKTRVKKSVTIKVIITIWIISSLLSIPESFMHTVFKSGDFSLCVIVSDTLLTRSVILFNTLFLICGPLVLVIILYLAIGKEVQGKCASATNSTQDIKCEETKIKIKRMIVSVTLSLIVCWFPTLVVRFLMIFPTMLQPGIWRPLLYATFICGYCCVAINPFIYITMSTKFRTAFKSIFHMNLKSSPMKIINT